MIKVTKAIARITGTNTPEILSASFDIGALELLASSTNLIIFAIDVSSPTLVALTLMYPAVTIVEE